ncbi:MAG: hypothetical protein WBD07_12320, partial [Vicinamibacterales bacterium]
MVRKIYSRALWAAIAVMVVAGGAVLAQSALAQLGLTEAQARGDVLGVVMGPEGALGSYTSLVNKGRAAYQKVPVAARGQVTTGLFAWAKTFASSPAFKTEYARLRAEGTPQPKPYPKTVEQELADMEKQMANFKMPEATIREQMKGARASIEAGRAQDKENYEREMKDWQARYPADSQGFVAKYLREFLAATAGLDFSAKVEIADTRVGPLPQFVDPALQNKPWQAVEAVYAGRE